uniref:heavy-metal-associated domain-containing protein n=1 Tax=Providencia rettgeri TaxID=587 RepID=UPI003F7D0C6C
MMNFTIPNMTCGGCAKSVTKVILELDEKAIVETDPANRKVQIQTQAEENVLRTALKEAGYPVDPA